MLCRKNITTFRLHKILRVKKIVLYVLYACENICMRMLTDIFKQIFNILENNNAIYNKHLIILRHYFSLDEETIS